MLILERNATACKLGFELTDVQLGCLVAKMLRDFEKENSVGKLEPGREDVGEEATEGHDPTPAALGVVVLPECGRFSVALQR